MNEYDGSPVLELLEDRQLAEVTRKHLIKAGLDDGAAREALGVLVVNAIGFAAFVTQTGGISGLVTGRSPGAGRASYIQGLHWLLTGILGSASRSLG